MSGARSFFLYMVTNPPGGANSVAAWRVDPSGNIAALPGSPFATGGNGLHSAVGAEYAHRIAVSWSQNRLFAANEQQGSIAVFNIDPTTGALSAVPGSPFVVGTWAGSGGTSLTVSNDGQFLYGSNASIVSFHVEANGALTEVGAKWVFAARVNGSAVSYQNDRLYLAQSDRVSVLKTGPTGITSQPPVSLNLGNVPTDVVINQAGTTLYVGARNGGINAFHVSGDAFIPISGTPFFGGTTELSGLAGDFYEHSLVAFGTTIPRAASSLVGSDGSLLPAAGSPLPLGIAPTGGTLSPDGQLLLLSNAASQLDAFTLDDSGTLTHVPSYPTSVGTTSGFSKLVAFPSKAPSAAPALPFGAALGLFAALALLGFWRSRRALA